jgi:hypothetical protein
MTPARTNRGSEVDIGARIVLLSLLILGLLPRLSRRLPW